MSKASIKAKREKEEKLNQQRIESYGACPKCGKGFTYCGLDASYCSFHGWINDISFVRKTNKDIRTKGRRQKRAN